MYNDIGIFIPTKGRLNKQDTYCILKNLNLNPTLVIEPQEEDEAIEKNYNFITLPENNKGISYSRNYILDFVRKYNYEYICMIDDDINRFGYIKDKKRIKDNNAFLDALKYFKEVKTCGTMQYTQFAWCQPKSIVYNKALEVVMFLYMPQLKNIYFEEDTIEDRDFSLDLILNHNITTFRLNHLYFQCPSIGTNKGGIDSDSRFAKQVNWSLKMEKKWGSNICEYVIKKNGVPDIKINWINVEKILKEKKQKLSNFNILKPKYEQLQFDFMKEFV